MELGFEESATPFDSGSQYARVWSESWVARWFFCPDCGTQPVERFRANRPVADFHCPRCHAEFELKSQKGRFGPTVADGAHRTMLERLAARNNPNLVLMTYDLTRLAVTNLFVVPRHFFTPDLIVERPPLAATARRAGWVGCNIRLGDVPHAGRVFVVRDGQPRPRADVLAQWRATAFLQDVSLEARGWLIEVLKCVEAIGRPDFTLDEVYAQEDRLAALYPGNNNVRPKIRQQLQVLRDRGYLRFAGRGVYRLTAG